MTDSLLDLSGKVTLVTGGSRGLGKAMVTAFAAHGADVIIASRKLAKYDAILVGRPFPAPGVARVQRLAPATIGVPL
jgi:NAD(P)-dependent dehydrogenase (short-subunit alcohol dehydrogenase family)